MACGSTNTVFVKIGRVGGTVAEYMVGTGTTYSDLFVMAKIGTISDHDQIFINGEAVSNGILSSFVRDSAIVLIAPKIDFIPFITVQVSRVGSRIKTIRVLNKTLAYACLRQAEIPVREDEELWLHEDPRTNGRLISPLTEMYDGYYIIVEKKKAPKTLKEKIADILYEDADYEYGTGRILAMLEKDYNIQ